MRQGGAAARYRSAALAVMIGTGLWSSSGAAQHCAFPAEAEAFAIASLRSRLIVGALLCRETAGYNDFVRRFELQLIASQALVRDHFARTAGAAAPSALDAWNVQSANEWSEHAIRAGQGYCDDTRRLTAELAGLPPGPSLVTVAERVNEGVPIRALDACRAPGDTPAPLQPR